MTCPHGPMADPYNREKLLRKQHRELRGIADDMAAELSKYVQLIREGGGDPSDIGGVLDRFKRFKAEHDG